MYITLISSNTLDLCDLSYSTSPSILPVHYIQSTELKQSWNACVRSNKQFLSVALWLRRTEHLIQRTYLGYMAEEQVCSNARTSKEY